MADTLPLPANLTRFHLAGGREVPVREQAREAYFPLSIHFVTQRTQAYCGVASMVMVLNALGVPAPSTPEYEPYHTFTQDNVLDERTDAVLPRDLLPHQGMTLDQLARCWRSIPCRSRSIMPATEPRRLSRRGERRARSEDRFVIVNYLRKALGQETAAISRRWPPMTPKADRFLILDVARYKYPPVWVKASDLFDAMNTPDPSNAGKTRGYVLVAKSGERGGAGEVTTPSNSPSSRLRGEGWGEGLRQGWRWRRRLTQTSASPLIRRFAPPSPRRRGEGDGTRPIVAPKVTSV